MRAAFRSFADPAGRGPSAASSAAVAFAPAPMLSFAAAGAAARTKALSRHAG